MSGPLGNPMHGVMSEIANGIDIMTTGRAHAAVAQQRSRADEWMEYAQKLEADNKRLLAKIHEWAEWGKKAETKIKAQEELIESLRKSRAGQSAVREALQQEAESCPNREHHKIAHDQEARTIIHANVSGGHGIYIPRYLSARYPSAPHISD